MKALFWITLLCAPAHAATSYILPGNAEYGFWDLKRDNYNPTISPAYPASGSTSTPWGGPIAASATSATFTRLAGGGYFIGSGSGIYGSFGTVSYGISDTAPMPDLANLIFQARMNLAPSSITLSLNGGSPITPGFINSTAAGSGSFGPISDFAWQWDLSAFAGTINSYQITLDFPANSLVYGNAPQLTTLSASDAFVQAVPEPSSMMMALATLGFTLTRRRRA